LAIHTADKDFESSAPAIKTSRLLLRCHSFFARTA
jgi:hypothetical protein